MKTLADYTERSYTIAKPAGVSPADWIKMRAMPLFLACSYNGVAECIMSVLRAMEIWARDNGKHVEEVVIDDLSFVNDDLVVSFK